MKQWPVRWKCSCGCNTVFVATRAGLIRFVEDVFRCHFCPLPDGVAERAAVLVEEEILPPDELLTILRRAVEPGPRRPQSPALYFTTVVQTGMDSLKAGSGDVLNHEAPPHHEARSCGARVVVLDSMREMGRECRREFVSRN